MLNDILKGFSDMNDQLLDLSKSAAILEQDIALYQHSPGVSSQSLYTVKNLPTFPNTFNVNEFSSGDYVVFVPVKTVDEVNDLNKILEDKIAFENIVSVFSSIKYIWYLYCFE